MSYNSENLQEDVGSKAIHPLVPVLYLLIIVFAAVTIFVIIQSVPTETESFDIESPEDLARAKTLGTNTWYKRLKNKCAYAMDGYLGTYYFSPGWYHPYVVSNNINQNYASLIKKNYEQRFRRMPWLNIGIASISEPELQINDQKWLLQTRYDPMRDLFVYRVVRDRKYMWLKEHNILKTGDYVHRIRYPLVKMRVKLF